MTAIGDKKKIWCGRTGCEKGIPAKRIKNAQIRGRKAKYCSDNCALRAARAAYRRRWA